MAGVEWIIFLRGVALQLPFLIADIVGIDVLERREHVAVDEFAVVLPDDGGDIVKLLVREIEEVDGASVEEWREVGTFPEDGKALTNFEWRKFTLDLIATRDGTRIRFEDRTTQREPAGTHIDHVSLVRNLK